MPKELRFEPPPAPKLLTPVGEYAALEVIDLGIVFARVEYYPATGLAEQHFRITTASREHIWISALTGRILLKRSEAAGAQLVRYPETS
jgi:hypothetical protein